MKKIYYPFVTGSDSPIPYMYEELIKNISQYHITTFSNRKDGVFDQKNVNNILIPSKKKIWRRRIKFGCTSLKNYNLIHTGGRGRRHYRISRIAHLRNKNLKQVHTLRVDINPNSRLGPTSYKKDLIEMADAVTAVSEHTAQTAEEHLGISPQVIYEGVNPNIFHPQQDYPNLFTDLGIDSPVFLFVGSFQPRKNPDDVVKVAKKVPEATFLMIGDGECYSDIQAMSKNVDNVVLTGQVPKHMLPQIYAHSTAFIFPTIREGCANVVLEAMASELPVLGYESTSMPEIVTDGKSGFLVEPHNSEQLAKQAIRLLNKEDCRSMGHAGRNHIVNNHSFEVLADQYVDLYNQILDE